MVDIRVFNFKDNIKKQINEKEMDFSKCPKCGGRLEYINEALADFDCLDCRQRMDKRDYIEWALKNFGHKIDVPYLFVLVFGSVNHEN